jgi:hypothetical protein
MLQKVGLLHPRDFQPFPSAYAMHARDDEEGIRWCMEFKQTYSIDVRIKFLGVWYVASPIDQLPTSNLRVGTPCSPSDGFQNTCHPATRTTLLRTSGMR